MVGEPGPPLADWLGPGGETLIQRPWAGVSWVRSIEPVLDEATTPDHLDAAELSPRELEVLRMTSFGLTNAEIAERLQVTVHAVKFHLARIYRRLGVANRTEAAVMYLRAQSPEVHANRDAPQTD